MPTGEGDDETDGPECELWDRVGRKAAAMELEGARYDADDALHSLTVETMFRGEDPTPEQVREARRELNHVRRVLEQYIAPAAGCEEWGEPVPDMPYSVYRDVVES